MKTGKKNHYITSICNVRPEFAITSNPKFERPIRPPQAIDDAGKALEVLCDLHTQLMMKENR